MFIDDRKGVWDYLCQDESGDDSEVHREAASLLANSNTTIVVLAIQTRAVPQGFGLHQDGSMRWLLPMLSISPTVGRVPLET